MNNSNNPSQPPNQPTYGAYKVSEYTHGKQYKVDESEIPARQKVKDDFISRLEQDADIDYKKKHRLGENKKEFKQECQRQNENSFNH